MPVDPAKITVQQVSYRSKDGTPVTMFLVHRKGLVRDGNNPTLLYGYGGFNINMLPRFSATLFPGWSPAASTPCRICAGRRVRRRLASGRHARQEAERLRRLHRRGRVADR